MYIYSFTETSIFVVIVASWLSGYVHIPLIYSPEVITFALYMTTNE